MNRGVPSPSKYVQILGLLGWLAVCFGGSAVGGIASANAGTFYNQLVRPTWAPPGWVFGPVWSILYLIMAIAAWLVWRAAANRKAKLVAISFFVAQLAANALWSWLFFAWQLGGLALLEIVLLWLLIACTILAFWRIKPGAGLILVPYLLWVTFASVLSWALWRANPGVLS